MAAFLSDSKNDSYQPGKSFKNQVKKKSTEKA